MGIEALDHGALQEVGHGRPHEKVPHAPYKIVCGEPFRRIATFGLGTLRRCNLEQRVFTTLCGTKVRDAKVAQGKLSADRDQRKPRRARVHRRPCKLATRGVCQHELLQREQVLQDTRANDKRGAQQAPL